MNGIQPLGYRLYENHDWQEVKGAITEEIQLYIHVNGKELASLMCTPHDLDELVLGFLRSEGIIRQIEDVRLMTTSASGTRMEIWLNGTNLKLPNRRVNTFGHRCGGTFGHPTPNQVSFNTKVTITPQQVIERMHDLYCAASLYQATQGIHTSGLSDGERLIIVAEDVGRHNTIDRLWGKAMKQGISTKGLILFTTGRINTEMLAKTARMEVPIITSRTSATSLSLQLAQVWNITVIGYVRQNSFRVYTASQHCLESLQVKNQTPR